MSAFVARRRPLTALATALLLALPDCAPVGRGPVDHGIPAPQADRDERSPVGLVDVLAVKLGTRIEVQLSDGELVSGRYAGLEPSPLPAYRARYEEARAAHAGPPSLPQLGQGTTVRLVTGVTHVVDLVSFEPWGAQVIRAGSQAPVPVMFDRIDTLIDAAGTSVDGKALAALAGEHRLPYLSALLVDPDSRDRQRVPLDLVAAVARLGQEHPKGLNVGLAILVGVALVIIAVVASQEKEPPPPEYISCPFVDSFDGTSYHTDGEPFGGAIFAGAEHTDRARLDHLRLVGGRYRIRLRNELDELDHFDSVALTVVDHAPGSEVVPTRGGLAVLQGAVLPSRARSASGGDVTRLLARVDGQEWAGLPPAHDAAPLRDEVELTFPRPPGATSATLAFTTHTSALAPAMMREVLSLHGRNLPSFFARLDADASARARFQGAWAREALPRVLVRTEAGWRLAGVLTEVQTLVSSHEAIAVDLTDVPPGPLRLRVDAVPGMWAFDRVAAAFSGARPAAVQRLEPLRASVAGTDVLALLQAADGRRHTLRPGSPAVDVVFPAPPPRPGLARTVLLEATGFYQPRIPAEGEPRTAEFERLVTEPDAFARLVRERSREAVRTALARVTEVDR